MSRHEDAANTVYGGQPVGPYRVTWTKRPVVTRRESLGVMNSRISIRHARLLRHAEGNCLKLTGKPRL